MGMCYDKTGLCVSNIDTIVGSLYRLWFLARNLLNSFTYHVMRHILGYINGQHLDHKCNFTILGESLLTNI